MTHQTTKRPSHHHRAKPGVNKNGEAHKTAQAQDDSPQAKPKVDDQN